MTKFVAFFSDDEIVVTTSENGIASSEEDAILVLINSYTNLMHYDLKLIKILEEKIKNLRENIQDLMYEQRKVEVRRHKYRIKG